MVVDNYKPNDIYISNKFYNIKDDILGVYGNFTDLGNEISLEFKGFIVTLDNLFRLSVYGTSKTTEINTIVFTIEKIIKKYFKRFSFK
ncbi:hypothetical protein [uncultured Clostridium sp.]|jgi:hypothetical protein|uniref:hypothetical protein n=1 Tax=uncultured Clostridium sp. TaxID=59620 RepID=UPI00263242C4|nr:hypothetical protein [uncultured Clostridium sp.]